MNFLKLNIASRNKEIQQRTISRPTLLYWAALSLY